MNAEVQTSASLAFGIDHVYSVMCSFPTRLQHIISIYVYPNDISETQAVSAEFQHHALISTL